VNRYKPDAVSPPSETLKELMEERRNLGIPQDVLNGDRAIDYEIALQLESKTGVPFAFWLAREKHYRDSLK